MHLFIRVLFSLWNHHTKLYWAVYIILNEMLTESELRESRNDLVLNYIVVFVDKISVVN